MIWMESMVGLFNKRFQTKQKTTWISMHSILLSWFSRWNSLSIAILSGRTWPICVRICGKHEITILFSDFPISLKLTAMLTKIGCDFLQNSSSYIRNGTVRHNNMGNYFQDSQTTETNDLVQVKPISIYQLLLLQTQRAA